MKKHLGKENVSDWVLLVSGNNAMVLYWKAQGDEQAKRYCSAISFFFLSPLP